MILITDRIRSIAESTVFTGVCHSFCPRGVGGGCMSGQRGVSHFSEGGGVSLILEKMGYHPNTGIRSMRIRYTFYWNAFLFALQM